MLEWLSEPFLHRGRWSRRALLRAGAVGVAGSVLPRLLAGGSAATPRRSRMSAAFP